LNGRWETGVTSFNTSTPGHLVAQGTASVKKESGGQAIVVAVINRKGGP